MKLVNLHRAEGTLPGQGGRGGPRGHGGGAAALKLLLLVINREFLYYFALYCLVLGTRVLVTLIHALKRTGGRRGLATLCLGGGQAVALEVEV